MFWVEVSVINVRTHGGKKFSGQSIWEESYICIAYCQTDAQVCSINAKFIYCISRSGCTEINSFEIMCVCLCETENTPEPLGAVNTLVAINYTTLLTKMGRIFLMAQLLLNHSGDFTIVNMNFG